jgi:hypothetical protein
MGSEKEAFVTVKFTGTEDSSLQTFLRRQRHRHHSELKHARLQGRGTPVPGPPWTTSAIQFTNTDTSRDDVKFAAAHAPRERSEVVRGGRVGHSRRESVGCA